MVGSPTEPQGLMPQWFSVPWDLLGSRDIWEMRKEKTLALQHCSQWSGRPYSLMCNQAMDIQSCMATLIQFEEEDILEIPLLESGHDVPTISQHPKKKLCSLISLKWLLHALLHVMRSLPSLWMWLGQGRQQQSPKEYECAFYHHWDLDWHYQGPHHLNLRMTKYWWGFPILKMTSSPWPQLGPWTSSFIGINVQVI